MVGVVVVVVVVVGNRSPALPALTALPRPLPPGIPCRQVRGRAELTGPVALKRIRVEGDGVHPVPVGAPGGPARIDCGD